MANVIRFKANVSPDVISNKFDVPIGKIESGHT